MTLATTLRRRTTVTGGEIIARLLAAEGVGAAFGIVDGTYLGLVTGFRDHGIALYGPRHETCALHMAGAHARQTGGLGVAIASNGPGVANALPGVAVENAEGHRVLLLTSCRRQGIGYPDRGGTFQYFDQVGVTGAMSKWSALVPTVDRVAQIVRQALRISWTGRPGVVHLDVPEDVLNTKVEVDESWFREPERYRTHAEPVPSAAVLDEAADLLAGAERPMIHAGTGVVHSGAFDLLRRLADALGAPITTSWGGRTSVDERYEGAIPMSHLDAVRRARNEADVVLVLGGRIGETDWWGKPPYWAPPGRQRLIQVDLEAEALGVNKPVDLPIQAGIEPFLAGLLPRLAERSLDAGGARRWTASLRADVDRDRRKLDKHLLKAQVPMHPAHVPVRCQAIFGDDDILVIDGGNTSIWAHFFHEVRAPRTVLGTPKMGMLGAGVSQALGAQVAHPDRRVYCLIGDGAMAFHFQEIETAVRHELPVVFLVLCDRQWGMVKINQQFNLRPIKTLIKKTLDPGETINTDLGEIEFDQVARAMGAHGERVADPVDLPGAIERSVAAGRCAVIHVDVDPVAHMWAPALKAFKDMHGEPRG